MNDMNEEQNEQQSLPIPRSVQPVRLDPEQPVPAPVMLAPVQARKPKKKKETKGDRLQNAAQAVLDAVAEARSKVDALTQAISDAKAELEEAVGEVEAKLEDLKGIREDEYQGWYDNLPEGLQQSAMGEKLQTLLDIDLDQSMPDVPEIEEPNFDDIESAAQEVLDADLPLGFGRD